MFMLAQKHVASGSETLCDLDLTTITADELLSISAEFKLSAMGSRRVNCLVCWFDVMFPGDVTLSTSPHMEDTHWQNTVLPLNDHLVKQDTVLNGHITIAQHKKRSLDISLQYSIDNGKQSTRRYRLDENCSELVA